MTPTTSLLCLFGLLLSTATLTISTRNEDVVNPTLRPTFQCNPHDNNIATHPIPISCALAIIQLPEPARGVDWHRDAHGQVFYNRPLTSTGDPNSQSHLPREATVLGCRVKVELRPGVLSADLVWSDLSIMALMLVRRCVGDERIHNARAGPGSGGTCDVEGVRITIESAGPARPAGPVMLVGSPGSSSSGSNRVGGMDTTT